MRVQLKGVCHIRKKLADGQVRDYWYAWRGGPRLEGSPGTAEFIISYNDAIATRKRPLNNDLNFLLDAYQDSEAFRRLALKTKKRLRSNSDFNWKEVRRLPNQAAQR